MSTDTYNADSIQVLNSIEHIQKRRGMYIGEGLDPRQLIFEIMDNAVDEIQAGHSDKMIIHVDTKLNQYTVQDFGRGIPHGKMKLPNGVEKEVVEVLMTEANSGGKFDNTSYKHSGGLNGLGMTITNALSNEMEVTTCRDKKFVSCISYGGKNTKVTTGKSKERGTTVRFIPNPTMFKSAVIPTEYILNRCRTASAFGAVSELYVDSEQLDTNYTIFDLIQEDTEVSTYVDIPKMEVTNDKEEKLVTALRYTSDTKDRYFAYTNMLTNYLGGSHVNALYYTLIDAWKEFVDSHKNIAPKVKLRDSDYVIGLRGVVAVFIDNEVFNSDNAFSSQTKEKLVLNKKYFDDLMNNFKKDFKKYLTNNILVAQQLIKRFEEYRVAQNALLNRKEISSLIKVSNDDPNNIRKRSVVSKLIECTSTKRDEREMYIVEGDSAAGPFMNVRDRKTQAVLPLRGKILNVTYRTVKEAVQNKEVCDIANSIGCGIGANCDASKSRYNKIIINSDADVDGGQIACLVLSLFVNMFPDMIKQGRVYVAQPPLYVWGDNPKNFGSCDKIEDIPKNVKTFHRMKGLGEMQDEQLEYFLVNKNTRKLIQIEFPSDVDKFNKILGSSEGRAELMKEVGIVI